MLINRFLIILASAERLAMGIQHFKSKHLMAGGTRLVSSVTSAYFLMRQDQHLLGEVLRYIPRQA